VRCPTRSRGGLLIRMAGLLIRVRLGRALRVVSGRPVPRRGPRGVRTVVLELLIFGSVIPETTSRLTVLDHGGDYM
jgi:hypothetical protein